MFEIERMNSRTVSIRMFIKVVAEINEKGGGRTIKKSIKLRMVYIYIFGMSSMPNLGLNLQTQDKRFPY